MEELRTEFDNFIKEWQQKGYSYDTLYAWLKQKITDYESSRVELRVIKKNAGECISPDWDESYGDGKHKYDKNGDCIFCGKIKTVVIWGEPLK